MSHHQAAFSSAFLEKGWVVLNPSCSILCTTPVVGIGHGAAEEILLLGCFSFLEAIICTDNR
jgi:hypothetical protein